MAQGECTSSSPETVKSMEAHYTLQEARKIGNVRSVKNAGK